MRVNDKCFYCDERVNFGLGTIEVHDRVFHKACYVAHVHDIMYTT